MKLGSLLSSANIFIHWINFFLATHGHAWDSRQISVRSEQNQSCILKIKEILSSFDMLPGFCSLKHSRWDKVRADHCCMDSIFALHAKFHSKWFIESDGTKLTGTIVSQSVNPDQPSRACDVDDMSVVSFDHSWEECFTSLCGERKKMNVYFQHNQMTNLTRI